MVGTSTATPPAGSKETIIKARAAKEFYQAQLAKVKLEKEQAKAVAKSEHGKKGSEVSEFDPAPKGKFTPDRQEAYLRLIARGVGKYAAANTIEVGVHPRTVERYERAHPEFHNRVLRAEGFRDDAVENAMYVSALSGNVIAQQIWLYNRRPPTAERPGWRDARRFELTGKEGGPIEIQERCTRLAKRMDEIYGLTSEPTPDNEEYPQKKVQ